MMSKATCCLWFNFPTCCGWLCRACHTYEGSFRCICIKLYVDTSCFIKLTTTATVVFVVIILILSSNRFCIHCCGCLCGACHIYESGFYCTCTEQLVGKSGFIQPKTSATGFIAVAFLLLSSDACPAIYINLKSLALKHWQDYNRERL